MCFAITYPSKHYGIIIVADSLDDAEARYQSQHDKGGGQAEHDDSDRQDLRGAALPIEPVDFRAVRHLDNRDPPLFTFSSIGYLLEPVFGRMIHLPCALLSTRLSAPSLTLGEEDGGKDSEVASMPDEPKLRENGECR